MRERARERARDKERERERERKREKKKRKKEKEKERLTDRRVRRRKSSQTSKRGRSLVQPVMASIRRTDELVEADRVLRKDFMMKRSRQVRMSHRRRFGQLAGLFLSPNFQSRWFVLTEQLLSYHEGSLEVGLRR